MTTVAAVFVALAALAGTAVYIYGPALSAMTTGTARFLGTDSPKRYTSTVLQLAELGIYSDSNEFKAASERAREAAKDADSLDDVRGVLADAVHAAGGKHSQLHPPSNSASVETQESGVEDEGPAPSVNVDGGVALATVPDIGRRDDIQSYADTLANGLAQSRDGGACGAVIDLRGNGGGDMGPMLAGLSPLLPDGRALEFVYSGRTSEVVVEGNSVAGGGTPVESSGGKWQAPVAVLVDGDTASSGEATMLSFRGLDNSRSFGTPTAGYASANTVYDFPDGSELMLTIAHDRDRTGKTYAEEPIEPDEESMSSEAALADAKKWLSEEHSCK